MKTLDNNLSDSEESRIRDQLLEEFKPADVCPMVAQLFTNTTKKVYQLNSNKHKSVGKVLETAQAERLSNFPYALDLDESYKEMANLYNSLLMGRQQKIDLTNRHSRRSLSSISSRNSHEIEKQTASHVLADAGFRKGRNPVPDMQKIPHLASIGEVSTLCSAEYEHNPESFMLPASSPYDNFLKASGC
ncbi:Hypothetical predicted protein [Olea europaea subsp. europaea]|uniref:Uncharacterized protein n=1 Tax=Olea europaea subsp. europaea TaxID=158383 RepID=A0A8S0TY30_OLEEU|nr:Hypothetical predicted protein [Olea europaea subsp. europaea]